MKKWICIFLCLALLLCLVACDEGKPSYEKPVQFYYRTAATAHDLPDQVIGAVAADGAGYENDPTALINVYLKGTSQEGFQSTFPYSTKLLSLEIIDSAAVLMVNSALSRLSGPELTIACACLSLTTMELTGVSTVRIRSGYFTLDGAEEIIMTRENLILQDLYPEEAQ